MYQIYKSSNSHNDFVVAYTTYICIYILFCGGFSHLRFAGDKNPQTLKKQWSVEFIKHYDMVFYPFDTQAPDLLSTLSQI